MEHFSPVPNAVPAATLFEKLQNHFSYPPNVALIFNNPEDVVFDTDEDYAMTILRNLTGNAIKSMESRDNPKIEWTAWQEKRRKYLSIRDNGPGGTPEKLRALYDDSFVSGTRTGLGLHLIRDLPKAIGCTISFDSEINKGTTFTLSFTS